jgi:hypothetical protein
MNDWLPSFGLYAMTVDDIETEQVIEVFSKIIGKEEANKMRKITTMEKLYGQAQAEGIAEGIAEGEVKAGRAMVLRALRTRFKVVPKDIEEAICQKSDPIVLESLLEQVIESNSLEEFAEGL